MDHIGKKNLSVSLSASSNLVSTEDHEVNLSKQRQQQLVSLIESAPFPIAVYEGLEMRITHANLAVITVWGKGPHVVGKTYYEVLPELADQNIYHHLEQVFHTGIAYHVQNQKVDLFMDGILKEFYFNYSFTPLFDTTGKVYGIMNTAADVSEQVFSRKELENAYEQIQLSKKASQLGTFDMDLSTGNLMWDDRCRELFGVHHKDPVTYEDDFVKGLHAEDRRNVVELIDQLVSGRKSDGDYDIDYRTIDAENGQVRWIRAKGKVYYQDSIPKRFIGSVLDITDQKQNELRLTELSEKQAILAALVNSTDDIIISKNLDGIINSWNPAAEKAFGYTEQEAIGQHISIIIPEDRLQEEAYIISQIKQGNKVDHFETIRTGKNNRENHLSITVSPVVNHNGEIIGASKIAKDISQQIHTQHTAQKYTQRLEVMNRVMKAISEELDLQKILQKVTDATTELTGAAFGAFFYNTVDDAGESYNLFTLSGAPREAFEKFGVPRNTAVFSPTFSGTAVVRVADITKDPRYGQNAPHQGMPTGHLPVVSYLAVPVISRSGHVIGGLLFGHPGIGVFSEEHENLVTAIAAQAAISLDNAKLFEEVKALNDKKDEFIGLASHELKTPLASISGYLQILSRMTKEEQHQKFLFKASNQVNRLTSLVNDLLDVSKIEAGKLQLSVASFDLKHAIEEAIELIQYSTNKYKINLHSNLESMPIMGDARRIEQVIINLLGNAIKYAPLGECVEVTLEQKDMLAIVSIKDQGPGIPANKLKNIFTRFYRLDESNPNISGLGIGLYLANEIIQRHQGTIWAESELNSGSTFYFALPLD